MISDTERRKLVEAAQQEAARLRSDPETPRKLYWLSFADPDRPEGQRFLGGCLIDDAVNAADAITQSHQRGCNPGGEVAIAEFPLGTVVPEGWPVNTLMSRADMEKFGPVELMP